MPDQRLSPTAGTTEATLVKNALRVLQDLGYTDTHSNAPAASGALTVATDATTRYEVGDVVDWVDDGTYDISVLTAVATTSLARRGGQFGSTDSAHAVSAVFRKNPRFFGINAQKAVNDAIAQDFYPDLFAVYEAQFTSTDWGAETTLIKSIAAEAEDVLYAYQKTDGTPTRLARVRVTQPFYVDTALSATKKAVEFSAIPDNNNTIFVQYVRTPALADLSDGMQRVAEYGAAKRLLEQEGAETAATDRPQSGALVPGQEIRDARWFAAEQDRMRRQEAAVLRRRFPRRRRNWIPYPHLG